MSVEEQISELVDKYEHETDKSQSEADLRAGYIDQLFFALGWNIHNDPGQLTNYRREGYIRGVGYVDVGLEIAGQPVLMLEAKKFGVLTHSAERAYDRTPEEKQLFRYARGKKIPYCILTNFERLHVFNADHERLILAFDAPTSYLDRISELLLLSPEKVKAGSLAAWERRLEIKDVDEAFLVSLQGWRLHLANAIYEHNLGNPALQTDGGFDFSKLMAAVQRILDRLILIRYADDKEVLLVYDVIETILTSYRRKGSYTRADELMQELIDLSHRMDEHHNTTLFQPGHICEQVSVPNEVLEKIMTEMNNISFRKFTSDILGNTYETYLGTKLALKNGEIRSEERRDIRKAGGIFFTPTMIVHYIVDNTLGQLLKELESQHGLHAIEKAREIRVLDPACGSGSFLIYAYQVLADFYRRMNKAIENEQVKLLSSGAGKDMFERLELFKHLPKPLENYPHHILEKQLYGVDIDPEAAEIAAVNLTMQAFADTRREKLPLILNENIKVGNSLISGSEEELRRYFGDNWQEKKPFNWEEEFKDIMANGGFDVVIGNPPHGAKLDSRTINYISHSNLGMEGSHNSAILFTKRGLQLTRVQGLITFVIPKSFCYSDSWKAARLLLYKELLTLLDVSMGFENVLLEQVVFVAKKGEISPMLVTGKMLEGGKLVNNSILDKKSYDLFGIYITGLTHEEVKIGEKIRSNDASFAKVCHIKRGVDIQDYLTKHNWKVEVFRCKSIGRYVLKPAKEGLTSANARHLNSEINYMSQPKIIIQNIVAHITKPHDHIMIMATIDRQGVIGLGSIGNIYVTDKTYTFEYLTALLNSNLISWYAYHFIYGNAIRTMRFDNYHLSRLPLVEVSEINQKPFVTLVNRILAITKDEDYMSNSIKQANVKELEREINHKVYELYGLTEEERQVVEASL